jgi:hypothetical protein
MAYRLTGLGKNSLFLNPTTHGRNAFVNVKQLFFDRPAVQNAMDRATNQALSRFGAYVRSDAKRSLRKAGPRTPPSTPPAPPRSRSGLLKASILFAYEREKRTVVIGPVKLPRMIYDDNLIMLEYGGKRRMKHYSHGNRRSSIATYKARPFMRPAYDKNIDNAHKLYKNSW